MNGGHPGRHLCVVLHDVSPLRWAACTRLLAQLQRVTGGAPLPLTLLVVPHMHGRHDLPPPYLRWLQAMAAAGHEIALHGLTHRDDAPPARRWTERWLRRVYTDGEGEFAALGFSEAARRLRLSRAWAAEHGLPIGGFVPPAWLMNAAGWSAVAQAGFPYSCTLNRIVTLPDNRVLTARSLVFSNRNAWRRAASVAWNHTLARQQRHSPLLRLELHPADADHPALARCWQRLLAGALRDRQPLSLYQASRLVHPA